MKYGLITDMGIGMDFMSTAKTHSKKVNVVANEHKSGKKFLCKEIKETIRTSERSASVDCTKYTKTVRHSNNNNELHVVKTHMIHTIKPKPKTEMFKYPDKIGIG